MARAGSGSMGPGRGTNWDGLAMWGWASIGAPTDWLGSWGPWGRKDGANKDKIQEGVAKWGSGADFVAVWNGTTGGWWAQ